MTAEASPWDAIRAGIGQATLREEAAERLEQVQVGHGEQELHDALLAVLDVIDGFAEAGETAATASVSLRCYSVAHQALRDTP